MEVVVKASVCGTLRDLARFKDHLCTSKIKRSMLSKWSYAYGVKLKLQDLSHEPKTKALGKNLTSLKSVECLVTKK